MHKSKEIGIEIIFKDLEEKFDVNGNEINHSTEPIYHLHSPVSPLQYSYLHGHTYVVERGHGVLITPAMTTSIIPLTLVAEHNLETGEFIEARAYEGVVESITAARKTRPFRDYKTTRPHRAVKARGIDFKFGHRAILHGQSDFIEHIANMGKELKNTYKIALVIDESDDCLDYLKEHGIDEVYLAKANHNPKKRVLFAILALFSAKEHARDGKDVIMFVDNLNKLFRIYNSSNGTDEVIETTELHHGQYSDLKAYFMEAQQIANSGSLTIIMGAKPATAKHEQYCIDEFKSLANVCYEIK